MKRRKRTAQNSLHVNQGIFSEQFLRMESIQRVNRDHSSLLTSPRSSAFCQMVGDGRAMAFSLYGSNCLSEPESILHPPRRQCHRNVITRVAGKEDALEAQLIECNGPPRMGGVSRGGRPTLPTTPFSGAIRSPREWDQMELGNEPSQGR